MIVPKKIAMIRKTRSIVSISETRISWRVPEGWLCLTGSRPRGFREGISHWVNARDGIVTGFAEQFRHARFLQNQFVPIDRELAPCFALPILQRFNAIIESRDCHTAFAIMERGKQLCEGSNWVCNRTSKNAGM